MNWTNLFTTDKATLLHLYITFLESVSGAAPLFNKGIADFNDTPESVIDNTQVNKTLMVDTEISHSVDTTTDRKAMPIPLQISFPAPKLGYIDEF